MDVEKRRWLEVLTRGLVLYVPALVGMQREFLSSDPSGGNEVELRKRWFDRMLRRVVSVTMLLSDSGEGPRRLLCFSLMEKALTSCCVERVVGDHTVTEQQHLCCMEMLVLFDIQLTKHYRFLIWDNSILFLFNNSLSEPLFRVPFAELLLKYREGMTVLGERHITRLIVQVFSVKNVVDDLLRPVSHPKWESILGGETILHRVLSTVLYIVSLFREDAPALSNKVNTAWVCCHQLVGTLMATENSRAIVASRQLYRAWCRVLGVVNSISMLGGTALSGNFDNYNMDKDCAMAMGTELQQAFFCVANMIYDIAIALCNGEAPIEGWLKDSITSFPRTWRALPATSAENRTHREELDALALQQDETVLLFETPAEGQRAAAARAYVRELVREFIASTNAVIRGKREAFASNEIIFKDVGDQPVLERYDALDRSSPDPVSFVVLHLRFFGLMVKSWMRVLQRMDRGSEVDAEPFIQIVSDLFVEAGVRVDYWIDEVLMPLVLQCQVEQGMWNVDQFNISKRCEHYLYVSTSQVEADMCTLQMLMLLVPTDTFASHLLQRHVFSETNQTLGFSGFLRLILTLCVNNCCLPIDDEADLRSAMRRRVVHVMARDGAFPIDTLEVVSLEFCGIRNGVVLTEMLTSILEGIAVSVKTRWGNAFYLKDADTWNSCVNLYHPCVRDFNLPDMYEAYDRLVRKKRRENNAMSTATSHDAPVMFPPPSLEWIEEDGGARGSYHSPVFRYSVCSLLQSPCVLSVAIHIIHRFVHALPKRKSSNAESEDGATSAFALTHAVSVLYLAMKACLMISPCTADGDPRRTVDWEAMDRLQAMVAPPPSYVLEQLTGLFGAEGSFVDGSLKRKLERPVEMKLNVEEGDHALPVLTTIDALFELRLHFRKEAKDLFNITQMTEFILWGGGWLSVESDMNDVAREEEQCEQREEHRRRMKERQFALFSRMKAINTKKSAALLGEAVGTDSADPTNAVGCTHEDESHSSLTTMLLRRLEGLECCMCRDVSDEPILLFGNASSSDALDRLSFSGAVCESEGQHRYKMRTHVQFCGHGAHKRCVMKTFGRMAKLWMSPSPVAQLPAVLCPSELQCPICLMVVTLFCPRPVASLCTATDGMGSLFELTRRDTLAEVQQHEATREAQEDMHRSIAHIASEGQSDVYHSAQQHASQRRPRESSDRVREFVEVLRSIRTQMCAMLEWVKVGGNVRYTELLAIFSLILSLDPSSVGEIVTDICAELCSAADAFCVLLVNALLVPGSASEYVAWYTASLLRSANCIELTSPPKSGDDDNVHNGLLIAMWRELGCMTLLMALLDDNLPPELVRITDDQAVFVTLQHKELATLEGQQRAVLHMLCYLLGRPLQGYTGKDTSVAEALASLVSLTVLGENEEEEEGNVTNAWHLPRSYEHTPSSHVVQCEPSPVPYGGADSWRFYLMRKVFHLTNAWAELLLSLNPNEPCSVCGNTAGVRLLCCFCGKPLCLKPPLTPPELYAHALSCGNGLGIYFSTTKNSFFVFYTPRMCYTVLPGPYADEHGFRSTRRLCSRQVSLHDGQVMILLSLWIRSRWSIESTVVSRMDRISPQIM
uniref:E3 ubiquitin-protein ligase n=1 Tax=Trypanosoma congolense (strain IL3000) TaxID=1068625 RepID=F9WH18_TRYCI|nr:unnamed protein product [Trypanosoma congolense IL3000]